MHHLHPSASYSLTVRIRNPHTPGMVGRIASAIGEMGGLIGSIDVIETDTTATVRDFVIAAADQLQEETIAERLAHLDGVSVLSVADRTFQTHHGGKIEIAGRLAVKSMDDLAMVYTPGVARVYTAIANQSEAL